MFQVENISFGYGARDVLDGVSFSVGSGDVVALLGANGAGKSTLLKIIAGVLMPSVGVVRVDGFDAFRFPLRWRRRVGYLAEATCAEDDLTVKQYLKFRAKFKGEHFRKIRHRVQEAMAACALEPVAERAVGELSLGLRRRVALAEVVLLRPRVLLLDDPFAGLDRASRAGVREVVSGLAGSASVVLAGHELEEIGAVATRYLVLTDGKVRELATLAEAEELLP